MLRAIIIIILACLASPAIGTDWSQLEVTTRASRTDWDQLGDVVQSATIEEAAVEPFPLIPKTERVVVNAFVMSHGCPPCDAAKAALNGVSLPFDVRWTTHDPGYGTGTPTFYWKSNSGWTRLVGWHGVNALKSSVERTTRVRTDSFQSPPPSRFAMEIPKPSSIWTHPDSIENHLRTTHGWTGPLPESKSEQERLHSSLHEGRIKNPYHQQRNSAMSAKRKKSFLGFEWE